MLKLTPHELLYRAGKSTPGERLTRIWISKERADGEKHFADCQGWAPLLFQDVQADLAIAVDVAMVDPGPECDLHDSIQSLCGLAIAWDAIP